VDKYPGFTSEVDGTCALLADMARMDCKTFRGKQQGELSVWPMGIAQYLLKKMSIIADLSVARTMIYLAGFLDPTVSYRGKPTSIPSHLAGSQ